MCAASIEQARLVYRFIRAEIEGDSAYRLVDSTTRLGITHLAPNTRLRVLSSNGKTAFSIVTCGILVADEPGSWEPVGGTLMYDAIVTALGKPGSPMKALFIGTLAPAVDGWWHNLVADGSGPTTYVQALQGDANRWDKWSEIRRCNPLTAIAPEFTKRLLVERDEARLDSRLKARFLSYRLNLPSGDESEVLLTVSDWEAIESRPVPERVGKAIVGVDLGGGRAWSSAVALWENGRCEALALAPGVPDLAEQERRDRVPSSQYQRQHCKTCLNECEDILPFLGAQIGADRRFVKVHSAASSPLAQTTGSVPTFYLTERGYEALYVGRIISRIDQDIGSLIQHVHI